MYLKGCKALKAHVSYWHFKTGPDGPSFAQCCLAHMEPLDGFGVSHPSKYLAGHSCWRASVSIQSWIKPDKTAGRCPAGWLWLLLPRGCWTVCPQPALQVEHVHLQAQIWRHFEDKAEQQAFWAHVQHIRFNNPSKYICTASCTQVWH